VPKSVGKEHYTNSIPTTPPATRVDRSSGKQQATGSSQQQKQQTVPPQSLPQPQLETQLAKLHPRAGHFNHST